MLRLLRKVKNKLIGQEISSTYLP